MHFKLTNVYQNFVFQLSKDFAQTFVLTLIFSFEVFSSHSRGLLYGFSILLSTSTQLSRIFIASRWLLFLYPSTFSQPRSTCSQGRLFCTLFHHSFAYFCYQNFSSVFWVSFQGILFRLREYLLLTFLGLVISYIVWSILFISRAICSNFWLILSINELILHVCSLLLLELFIFGSRF